MTRAMGENAPVSRREMKRLMRRSDRPGLIRLALWLLMLLAGGALVWVSAAHPLLLVMAMFLHGIVMVHLFAIQHECSHYTAFRSGRLCDALAYLCGFLLAIPPLFFRYEHYRHHTHTNRTGEDPQRIPLPASRWRYFLYLSALPYWYGQFAGLFRRAAGGITEAEADFLPAAIRSAVIRESRLILAGYAAIITFMLAADWFAPLFYWWLPLLLAEPVMRLIRMSEHVGCPDSHDMLHNTRTTLVTAPWRFLAWNMNYHTAHHYAAAVPFHALPALHEKLAPHMAALAHGYPDAHRDIISRIRAPRATARPAP